MEAVPRLRRLVVQTASKVETRLKERSNLILRLFENLGLKADRRVIPMVALQGTYGIALKILLYKILEERYNLPRLEGRSLEQLISSFEGAYEVTSLESLRTTALDEILMGSNGGLSVPLTQISGTIEGLRGDEDVLGLLYKEVMPQEERRRLGGFYTPRHIAEFMVRWAIRNRDDTVFDPGVGSGTFLIEALYRLMEMKVSRNEAISKLYGVDINPLAVAMATINLLTRAPKSLPNIALTDFFNLQPSGKSLNSSREFPSFNAIICNPPYTRHHEMTRDRKEGIARLIEFESGVKVSRLSSLYLHFFIHAAQFLKEGSRIAFITPSEWLEVAYGRALREYSLRNLDLKAIVLFQERELVFPGVLTTATITLATKGRPNDSVKLIRVDEWPGVDKLIDAVERLGSGKLAWGRVTVVPRSSLDPKSKWGAALFEAPMAPLTRAPFVPLGKIARVSRGIATGANEFFTLTDDEVRMWGIETECLVRVVAGARFVKHYDLTLEDLESLRRRGVKTWLLWCFRPKPELEGSGVLKYIRYGEGEGYDRRYLTRTRKVWYWVERRGPAPILFTYMSRKEPRFIWNLANAYVLNTLHVIYLPKDIAENETLTKTLLAYLNSGTARLMLREVGRVYGGGLRKVEPMELGRLPVLDPRELKTKDVKKFARLFDELRDAVRAGGDVQRVRGEIDLRIRLLARANTA